MNASLLSVFIQCEAGSRQRNRYDEQTLEWQRTFEVPVPYPYPYGFVPGTSSPDGGCLDCYVINARPLPAGQIVLCEPIGLMEQFEGGGSGGVEEIDHKVLARLAGEPVELTSAIQETLTGFIYCIFASAGDGAVRVGRFLGREAAEAHIAAGWNAFP